MYSFIETKLFSRLVAEHLSDEEYAKLQQVLIESPDAGDVIPGSGWNQEASLEGIWPRKTRRRSRHLLRQESTR